MNWTSLKLKLPFFLGLAVAIPLFIFTYFSYTQINTFFVKEKLGDMMNLADTKFIHVLDLLDRAKAETRRLSLDVEIASDLERYNATGNLSALDLDDHHLRLAVKNLRLTRKHSFGRRPATRNRFDELMVLDDNGVVVASSKKSSIGQDYGNTPFFATKKMVFVDAHRDSSGEYIFGYAAPIRKNNQVIGVLVSKINVKLLELLVTGELGNVTGGKLFWAGFRPTLDFYIINRNGYMITQSRVLKKDTVLKQKGSREPLVRLLKKDTGDYITNIGAKTGAREAMGVYPGTGGNEKAIASMPVFDTLWSVVVEQNTEEAFSPLINFNRLLILAAIVTVLLTAGTGYYVMSRSVINPLEGLAQTAKDITGGNLDKRVNVTSRDEIGVMGEEFNRMAESLGEMIESEKEARTYLEEMINEYKETTEQNKRQATVVAQAADRSVKIAEEGTKTVVETVKGMNTIMEKVGQIAENSAALSRQTEQIGKIISSVNDLAEQSNILAINASIEAARAGEYGKGFGIVASEVKKLAEQSQKATAKIATILNDIQKASIEMVSVTEEGKKEAAHGVILGGRSGETIKALAQSIEDNSRAAQLILQSAISRSRQNRISDKASDRAA